MLRIVADLGNSRLKWARLDEEGRLTPSTALPPDDPLAWDALWDDWHQNQRQPSRWAIASVNPPVAQRSGGLSSGTSRPPGHLVSDGRRCPARDGRRGRRDRRGRPGLGRPGSPGAHAPRPAGPGRLVWHRDHDRAGHCRRRLAGRGDRPGALPQRPRPAPPHRATSPGPSRPVGAFLGPRHPASLEAGVFWGTVGAVRELLARQSFEHDEKPWIVWTGGDAERLARAVCGEHARIIPDLVLNGLVRAVF